MEALGTLAGGIAHDFNNMLAAIRGNARLAIEDLPPDSPAIASLREIERSSVRAAELVRQILTFSRQEPSKRRPIDMRATVSEAVRLLRATLPAMIEINTDLASDLPMVRADPTQIHQVLMNLGVNAAHAIGARTGRIDVRLDLVDAAPGEGDPAPRPHVRLPMIDTGGGMDEATMERIFDPFFTTKPAGYGVGLGLSVVHGIMEAHEGAVAVESTPGRGATFSLYFPAIESAPAPEPPPLAEAPAGAGQHILYVDDEDALVSLAERGLSRRGYRVSGYVSPARALEAFRADPQKFDFVVTDLAMPGMSGRDLASELLRIRPDIPIVLTSGRLMPAEVQEMQALGIRNVMPKPSSVDDLARMIAAVLGSRT
jgi:CheY-like chemotaxis protein